MLGIWDQYRRLPKTSFVGMLPLTSIGSVIRAYANCGFRRHGSISCIPVDALTLPLGRGVLSALRALWRSERIEASSSCKLNLFGKLKDMDLVQGL